MKFDYLELHIQPCPCCEGLDFEALVNNDRYLMGLNTVGCVHCGLVQTNPRPSAQGLNTFYSNFYRRYYQGVVSPSQAYVTKMRKEERFARAVSFIRSHINLNDIKGEVLDVGCSEGGFFKALRMSGFDGKLFGVEPNRSFAEYAEKTTNAKVYESLDKLDEKVDLVVLNHVFEHLYNPISFLSSIKKNLKKHSYVYIDVPDAEAYKSIDDIHIAHLFHFTTRTLSRIIADAGYHLIVCEQHNPPFHPPSIRVLINLDVSKLQKSIVTNKKTEGFVWDNLKQIKIPIKKVVRLMVLRIPYSRVFYNFIRSLFQ